MYIARSTSKYNSRLVFQEVTLSILFVKLNLRRRGGKLVNPPHVKLTAQKGQGRDKEGEPAVKFLLSSSHSGISREQVAGHISNFTLSDGKVQINEEIRSLEHFIGFY